MTTTSSIGTALRERRDLQLIGALAAAQVLLVGLFFLVTTARPTGLRYVFYPIVWITVGVWAVVRTPSESVGVRLRAVATGVALAYLLVIAWLGGLVDVFYSTPPPGPPGLDVLAASPGWGPAIVYTGETLQIVLVPYLVVGYLALAYLVYVAVVDVAGAALSGLVGLASCVSCSFPIVASLVAGVAGGTSALTTAVYALSIDLSTAAFLLAVCLLYWRPSVGP